MAELNKKDILMDQYFSGCKATEDGKCSVGQEDIEGQEWQDVDSTKSQGEDEETLKSESSYMICTKGWGIIYFMDVGQQVRDFIDDIPKEILKVTEFQEYIRIKALAKKWNINESLGRMEKYRCSLLGGDWRWRIFI